MPAMIYYGVRSEEAILMRMHNVPRSISEQIGGLYRNQTEQNGRHARTADVLSWLDELPDDQWKPTGKSASGSQYKQIWRMLSGIQKSETLK